MSGRVLLEACVDSVESAIAAQAGGAHRIELCDNLLEGGTTASAGTIEVCREQLHIPIHAMIRPRGGDFVYSDLEIEVMQRDITLAKRYGVQGLVFGVLQADGVIDRTRMRALLGAARPLPVTFHRAFDFTPDADEALETLAALGVDRLLTSGQAPTAMEGTATIARMVQRALGRLVVMAGGGLSEDSVQQVVAKTGVREVHVRATGLLESPSSYRPGHISLSKHPLPNPFDRAVTDPDRIRRLSQMLQTPTPPSGEGGVVDFDRTLDIDKGTRDS